jgi:glyoxalase family protein
MNTQLLGLHHVTAIVNDPQENVAFYAGVLGLRLIKRTVNFDDPYTYHLYYGDEVGSPGTIMTFFPWPDAPHGSRGTGQVSAMSFAVPTGSLTYWADRLDQYGVRHSDPEERFAQPLIAFYDPSGLLLELIETPTVNDLPGWQGGPVPAQSAIRGFAGVTLDVANAAPSSRLLTEVLGFREVAQHANRTRYAVGTGLFGAHVDLVERKGVPFGRIAAGSVHHVAWRVADDAAELEWQQWLRQAGVEVTEVRDRQYFHSIYFREPGGVLYEIATDTPGFMIDEPLETLGTTLQLPSWFEPMRPQIEQRLPALDVSA